MRPSRVGAAAQGHAPERPLDARSGQQPGRSHRDAEGACQGHGVREGETEVGRGLRPDPRQDGQGDGRRRQTDQAAARAGLKRLVPPDALNKEALADEERAEKETQKLQQEASRRLQRLLDAVKQEPNVAARPKPKQGEGKQGEPKEKDGPKAQKASPATAFRRWRSSRRCGPSSRK